ncbi:hypothetical protein CsSME_00000297 [Camellia sinensis var. sinensis]
METKNSLEHHQPSDSPKPSLDQEPSRRFWDILDLHKWEGFWYSTGHLEGTKDLQAHHESRDDDIVLASSIKTGTTWLKELEKVLWRCSLDRLKNLEVNKNGLTSVGIPKSSFFRLGVVGDWKNNLSNEMQEKLDQMTKMKLENTGLELEK